MHYNKFKGSEHMDITVLEAKTFYSESKIQVMRTIKDYEIDMERITGRIYSFGNIKEKKLYRGDILFRFPKETVVSQGVQSTYILTLDFSGSSPLPDYSRNIPGEFQKECYHPLISGFDSVIHPSNTSGIMNIYENLINLADKNSPAAKSLVFELLYSINAEICRHNYELSRPQNDISETVLSYIRNNPEKQMTLEDLASLVHLEKSYFLRLFKKSTGKTPIEMLISVRLDKASYLVVNTDMKICDIAPLCGYNTVSFFISAYKKRYGITPEEHRRRILQDIVLK